MSTKSQWALLSPLSNVSRYVGSIPGRRRTGTEVDRVDVIEWRSSAKALATSIAASVASPSRPWLASKGLRQISGPNAWSSWAAEWIEFGPLVTASAPCRATVKRLKWKSTSIGCRAEFLFKTLINVSRLSASPKGSTNNRTAWRSYRASNASRAESKSPPSSWSATTCSSPSVRSSRARYLSSCSTKASLTSLPNDLALSASVASSKGDPGFPSS